MHGLYEHWGTKPRVLTRLRRFSPGSFLIGTLSDLESQKTHQEEGLSKSFHVSHLMVAVMKNFFLLLKEELMRISKKIIKAPIMFAFVDECTTFTVN